ncbi:hypothetical protein [Hippea maritima]|uniref:Uncharacterized protein n=1 Tax=Hippea maritima (strain ATCC 700847 / DSM 10411 / MH2) TaxID=760142 RepID=F2LVI5_HIPMA|nr:hypothetical protein [Hippea maritima]AEA33769.1 hypothetical protein Hipma_0799 [Hippea maritima DSM 10411]
MSFEIDIIIDRKRRWNLKEMLLEEGFPFKEWFVEFTNDRSIISFEIKKTQEDVLKKLFEFLKREPTGTRIILPNGTKVNPFKDDFDRFYELVCEYIIKE